MVQTVSPQQARELMVHGDVEVIDVREPHEWMVGHIAGSNLVPLARFRMNPRSVLGDRPVLFVCAAGIRSEAAARLAASSGAKTVYNLAGGTRAWTRAGLLLELEPQPAVTAAE